MSCDLKKSPLPPAWQTESRGQRCGCVTREGTECQQPLASTSWLLSPALCLLGPEGQSCFLLWFPRTGSATQVPAQAGAVPRLVLRARHVCLSRLGTLLLVHTLWLATSMLAALGMLAELHFKR